MRKRPKLGRTSRSDEPPVGQGFSPLENHITQKPSSLAFRQAHQLSQDAPAGLSTLVGAGDTAGTDSKAVVSRNPPLPYNICEREVQNEASGPSTSDGEHEPEHSDHVTGASEAVNPANRDRESPYGGAITDGAHVETPDAAAVKNWIMAVLSTGTIDVLISIISELVVSSDPAAWRHFFDVIKTDGEVTSLVCLYPCNTGRPCNHSGFKNRKEYHEHVMVDHAHSNTKAQYQCPWPGCPLRYGKLFRKQDGMPAGHRVFKSHIATHTLGWILCLLCGSGFETEGQLAEHSPTCPGHDGKEEDCGDNNDDGGDDDNDGGNTDAVDETTISRWNGENEDTEGKEGCDDQEVIGTDGDEVPTSSVLEREEHEQEEVEPDQDNTGSRKSLPVRRRQLSRVEWIRPRTSETLTKPPTHSRSRLP